MGIALSSSTKGINNINAFLTQKVGNDKFKTLAGVYANVNLDGAPMLRGVFGEAYVYGHSLNVSYAQLSSYGVNIHTSLRINLYKDPDESYDFSVYDSENQLMGGVSTVSRFGANLSWSSATGHVVTIGASQSYPISSIAIAAGVKVNVWKSETGSSSFDISSSITHFVRGPLAGHQDVVASLTFTHNF